MESSPAIVENWRSRGVATAEAIVSGFAPGRLATTSSVGKSTFGRSLTPNVRYAIAPKRAIASINRLVATGLLMKISEKFTAPFLSYECYEAGGELDLI